jgi:hypothetical protein
LFAAGNLCPAGGKVSKMSQGIRSRADVLNFCGNRDYPGRGLDNPAEIDYSHKGPTLDLVRDWTDLVALDAKFPLQAERLSETVYALTRRD